MVGDGFFVLRSGRHGRGLWLGYDERRSRGHGRSGRGRELRLGRPRRWRGGGRGQSPGHGKHGRCRDWWPLGHRRSLRHRRRGGRVCGRHAGFRCRHERDRRATPWQRRSLGRKLELPARVPGEQHMCHLVWSNTERLRLLSVPSRHGERTDVHEHRRGLLDERLVRPAEGPLQNCAADLSTNASALRRRQLLRALRPHRHLRLPGSRRLPRCQ
jgi:hypothetical protein